jgi:hypothetical protein
LEQWFVSSPVTLVVGVCGLMVLLSLVVVVVVYDFEYGVVTAY